MHQRISRIIISMIISIIATGCSNNPSSEPTSLTPSSQITTSEPISDTSSTPSETSLESISTPIATAIVTFNVAIPLDITSGSKIKIAGDFNGWSPMHEDYELVKIDSKNYSLEIDFGSENIGKTILYKYVLILPNQIDNPWANVEATVTGGETSNRSYKLIEGQQVRQDTVAAFKNNISSTSLTRGTLTKATLTMTQYNDQRTRTIRIWTPDGYNPEEGKVYPVLYMHDGQNLFDTYTAFAGEWKIDEAIGAMMDLGYEGAIVVGIDNGNDRLNELTVGWPLSASGASYNIQPSGENYAAFIVETVKPYVDANFKTDASRESTFIGGSSLGGVMSFYMTLTYPEVFGQSLLFSTSMWVYESGTIATVINAANLGANLKKPKIYVYGGGSEGSNVATHVGEIYNAFIQNGYTDDLIKAHVEPNKGHNEAAWALHFPLAFNWLIS